MILGCDLQIIVAWHIRRGKFGLWSSTYTLSFSNLPRELVVYILEYVYHGIVKELTTLDLYRQCIAKNTGYSPYGRLVNQFRQLILVSCLFQSCLNHNVRMNGVPIIKCLQKIQMQKFITFLESSAVLTGYGANLVHLKEIGPVCGSVWRNSRLRKAIPELFAFESMYYLSTETLAWFRFCVHNLSP